MNDPWWGLTEQRDTLRHMWCFCRTNGMRQLTLFMFIRHFSAHSVNEVSPAIQSDFSNGLHYKQIHWTYGWLVRAAQLKKERKKYLTTDFPSIKNSLLASPASQLELNAKLHNGSHTVYTFKSAWEPLHWRWGHKCYDHERIEHMATHSSLKPKRNSIKRSKKAWIITAGIWQQQCDISDDKLCCHHILHFAVDKATISNWFYNLL